MDERDALVWILRGEHCHVERYGRFDLGRFASGYRATLTRKVLLASELVKVQRDNRKLRREPPCHQHPHALRAHLSVQGSLP